MEGRDGGREGCYGGRERFREAGNILLTRYVLVHVCYFYPRINACCRKLHVNKKIKLLSTYSHSINHRFHNCCYL